MLDRLVACERYSMWACSGSPASAAPPLPGHSWAVGHGVNAWGSPTRLIPGPRGLLSLSGSGRVSLMSFWARQVRHVLAASGEEGELPNRIKTVVAQSSSVPAHRW